tara:strand:- start:1182 stop:2006 length:825 start_codon:yes stop_codon:yes gene_type:complete
LAQDILAAPLGRQRLAGAANGVALTTTAAFTGLIQGTRYVDLIPRNPATAVVARYIECPYLIVLKTADALATPPIDYSEMAQDGDTGTSVTLSELSTAANNDFLYVGCAEQFRGVDIDVDAVNGTASVLTVRNWDGRSWADVSDTDNTESGGASLAQDGTVTWTVPTVWVSESLRGIGDTPATVNFEYATVPMYWTRWEWSAGVDAATTLDHMLAMNRSTAYAETPVTLGQGFRVKHGSLGGISGYEALTDAGTANLLVVCSTLGDEFRAGVIK